MSTVILRDAAPGAQYWTVLRNGQIIHAGYYTTTAEIRLTGQFDQIQRNGVDMFNSAGVAHTGAIAEFPIPAGGPRTFAAYDGFAAFSIGFYALVYFLLMLWIIRFISRILTNKNPSL